MGEARPYWRELPGEDLTTSALPEVAGWIAIYEEMASVLRSVISRVGARPKGEELGKQLLEIEGRLALWRSRHQELAGLVIDRESRTLVYAGKSLRLTPREADLLDLLLRHPGRPFTSRQLATLAWQNSRLADAQVRSYVMRLRNRLRDIGIDEAITVVRNRGYEMVAAFGRSADD